MFPRYTQKENQTTNYCGLVLRQLYRESSLAFENVLKAMTEVDTFTVGPLFEQQVKRRNSIPDLQIRQEHFEIVVEVKLNDWFWEDQLSRHLDGMRGAVEGGTSVLLLLSDDLSKNLEGRFEEVERAAKTKNITVAAATFEEFLETMRDSSELHSESLVETLNDFETYLELEGLIPKWKNRLDIVNCSRLYDEVIAANAYICPDGNGARSHKRSRFMGLYTGKNVAQVAKVLGVVVVGLRDGILTTEVKVDNADISSKDTKAELTNRAQEAIASNHRLRTDVQDYDHQLFILSDLHSVCFEKDSRFGMRQTKRYLENLPREVKSSEELATFLYGKKWSQFGL